MGKVKGMRARGKHHKENETGGVKNLSRKARRKEERKLVKLRRQAYRQGKQLPTLASLNKEKEDEVRKIKEQEATERKKRRKKAEKRRIKLKQQEKKEAVRQAFVDGLRSDEKEIKKYEKLLRLNKRKSKTISQGFKNDGLDFVLEAVEPDVLKSMVDRGDESEEDAASALDKLAEGESDESGSDIDEGLGENDEGLSENDEALSENDEGLSESDREAEGNEQRIDESDEESEEDYSGYYWPSDEALSSGNEIEQDNEEDVETKLSKKTKKSPSKELRESERAAKSVTSILKDRTDQKDTMLRRKNEGEKIVHFQADSDSETEHVVRTEKESTGLSFETPAKRLKNDNQDQESTEKETKKSKKKKKKKKKSKTVQSEGALSGRIFEGDDMSAGDNAASGEMSDNEGSDVKESTYKEDIYGRLRDEEGNVVTSQTAYVPPGKRLAMASSLDEKKKVQLERLKRQLKGQFNRLSESNMQSIASCIEGMFRTHSRAEITECLSTLMMESLISIYPVPERLIMEHCMLFAILHRNVGIEIGATLLQNIAVKFNELLKVGTNYGNGKEMENMTVVFANLYNFKIVHSLLIFDVMKKFAENFREKDIDLLLIMLRNVGFSLRKDDPVSLKEFIVFVQQKASHCRETESTEHSSRMKFMLEVIMHIKNNNMRKIPNYDPSHLEHLKKLLRSYTGSGSGEEELRISLSDLLSAEEKGKWWLVGSAWTGRESDKMATQTAAQNAVPNVSNKILELARKQRMNTDVRKNIFCVIMTSEDYVDAFEKLLQLGLKQQQEREIVHVILDLCLQEQHFNPFYAYLLLKFCQYDRRFQRTVQYNFWDKLKILETLRESQSSNLALLVAHMVAHKSLSLAVFKVVEFSELDKVRVTFMKTVLSTLLLRHDDVIIEEIFLRVAGIAKLNMLCEGLKLFLRHFLFKGKLKTMTKNEQEILKNKVLLAEKALSSKESKLSM